MRRRREGGRWGKRERGGDEEMGDGKIKAGR